jgi:hypothetical protein
MSAAGPVRSWGRAAAVLPAELTLVSGLILELEACPTHVDILLDEFDDLLKRAEELA